MHRDTIYALSSGRLPAGVVVVRLSGSRAFAVAETLAGPLPPPRTAVLRTFRDDSGVAIDRGLLLTFPAGGSFTGEEVAEFQLHGSIAVVARLFEVLNDINGLRLAEPGEFTRRAFDAGRLDLTAAEGLADLIDARTEAQRVQALAQSGGALAAKAEDWRARIIALMAAVEADIDFGDEGDVDAAPDHAAATALAADIDALLANRSGERIRDGFAVALVGAPNVGKSSLINILSARDVAIVSDMPGTTRDSIEVHLDIGGYPFVLIDTAGLRDSSDPVEQEGIRRTRARAASADLVLHLAEQPPETPLGTIVLTKSDLRPTARGAVGGLHVSAVTGEGIPALLAWLASWAREQVPPSEPALITRARQRDALTRAAGSLHLAAAESDPVLHAEALRLAARALAEVTGQVGVEHVLGEIFGRFCIGK